MQKKPPRSWFDYRGITVFRNEPATMKLRYTARVEGAGNLAADTQDGMRGLVRQALRRKESSR